MFNTKKKEQSVNDVVAEIHETFFTEVDRLLEEANITHPVKTDKQDVIDKANKLRSLGFGRSVVAKDAAEEEERLRALLQENNDKESLRKDILYFKQKYPLYKFITEDSVKSICEKYGLVYGGVENYIGDVPDKNLEQIEKFKIDKDDCIYKYNREMWGSMGRSEWGITNYGVHNRFMEQHPSGYHYENSVFERHRKEGLLIAAPPSDFDLSLMDIKDKKVVKKEVPDPIVLHPVIHSGKEHYLIVTAWGPEASDKEVINPINN